MAAEGITGDRVKAASWREAAAGVVGAVVTLAVMLTLGMLGYAALGSQVAEAGIPAAFIATAVGGIVVALRAKSVMPAGSLTTATTLIIAGIVVELAADPAVHPREPQGMALVICAMAIAVLAMGLLQIAFALLRLGAMAKFVPQPVLAGFMSAIAILILVVQLPSLLSLAGGAWKWEAPSMALLQPMTFAIGIGTALVIWLIAWRWPKAPAVLIGVAVGTLVDAALRYGGSHYILGSLTGPLPATIPLPTALAPLLHDESVDILLRHLPRILTTALVLAIIGSLESVLAAKATDLQTNQQHDANSDLFTFGLANIASAIFGGLPVVYLRARAAAIIQAGGRTWRAAAAAAVATGALFLAAGPLIALLPLAVLAGVMLTIAVGLVDRWTRELLVRLALRTRTRDAWISLAIVVVVCGITLWLGFAAGIAAGLLVSMFAFMNAMNRSLVRGRHTASAQPSRRVYPRAQEQALAPLRERIAVIGLQGAIFFGNAERLRSECDELTAATRFLVLDLSRVTSIDATGAVALAQLSERLAGRSVELMLAGVSAGNRHGLALLSLGPAMFDATGRWFPDVDHAVEAAEQKLLRTLEPKASLASVPFEACSLVAGLDSKQVDQVRKRMPSRTLAAGETLFREYDPGDGLYVLTKGSISVLYGGEGVNAMRQRYVSFSAGMMFGEVALLDGVGRTADAIADVESVVHELTRESLDELAATDPALCASLYRNIARHLAERLRIAAGAWSASIR